MNLILASVVLHEHLVNLDAKKNSPKLSITESSKEKYKLKNGTP